MSERWETQQEYRERTLAALESQFASAADKAGQHKANALLGIYFSAITAAAAGAETYMTRRWGYEQDFLSALGGLSLGYAVIQGRFAYRQRRAAFERWQTAAHFFIEED